MADKGLPEGFSYQTTPDGEVVADALIAPDGMSFKGAFAKAWKAGASSFRWRGKEYTTQRADRKVAPAPETAQAQPVSLPWVETPDALAPPGALSTPAPQGVLAHPPGPDAFYQATAPLRGAHGALTQAIGNSGIYQAAAPVRDQLAAMQDRYTMWNRLRAMAGLPPMGGK